MREDCWDIDVSGLLKRLQHMDVTRCVPMAQYTSFRTGGYALAFVQPSTALEIIEAQNAAGECGLDCIVIGNATNLLVSDAGVEALVVRIGERMADLSFDGARCTAGAGAPLSRLANESVRHGLAGLEWAAGIPGSVGGAVAMNAGAYGGEIRDVLETVTFIENREVKTAAIDGSAFGYRKSPYAAPNRVILSASFALRSDDGSAAGRMADYNNRRTEKQPLDFPSAGSTFKRPPGHFAGALIEGAGLKGFRIGGAEVSSLHAGFIINRGCATSADIHALIRHVQRVVFEHSGVLLEPEIKFIGRFD